MRQQAWGFLVERVAPVLRIAVPLIIAAVAVVVLHHLASEVRLSDLKRDVAATPLRAIALALLLTAANFSSLASYDVMAVRWVAPGRMPWRIAAATGAMTYAVANLLGFPWLTGGSVRYRVYSQYGLDFPSVAAIMATTWAALWLGSLTAFGVIFLLHPTSLSADLSVSRSAELAAGVAIVGSLGWLYWRLAHHRRLLNFGWFMLTLPPTRVAAGLNVAGVIDLATSALVLYVLVPADLLPSFPAFFALYLTAIALGIISHAPGGVGVFEATLIAGLGAGGRADMLAALLVYRLVYTVVPFALAAVAVSVIWIVSNRSRVDTISAAAYRISRPLVPVFAAGIAFLSGAVLLVSGNLPVEGARLEVLREILPLPLVEASHLAGSIAGALLLVVARGLYRRLRRAWIVALGLIAAGFVASIAKGLDWEEALTLLVATGLLVTFRSAFYRTSGVSVFQLTWRWILPAVILVAAITWIGFFAFSEITYRDDLWWRFAWSGDASRFLRALLGVSVVFAAVTLNALISGRGGPLPAEPIPDAVRRLVAASPTCEAAIALMGDKRFLLAGDERAFLSYADTGSSLISKGDPVGDPVEGSKLVWHLREKADAMGRRAAFYAVSTEYLPTYLDLGLTIVKIGEVARVDLAAFSLQGPRRKDWRHAKARAAREGLRFEIVPAAELDRDLPELARVSDAWLALKNGTEKGFALGAFNPDYLRNFDHAILRHSGSGRIVAFANLLQGAGKYELSVDLMRHGADAPNATMDALFAEIMLWGRDQGYRWFSLGAAPLAGIESRRLAPLWAQVGGFIFEHGERFYGFEGLRAFKEKFDPVWSPNYLACRGGVDVARTLYEVNRLISGGIVGVIGRTGEEARPARVT